MQQSENVAHTASHARRRAVVLLGVLGVLVLTCGSASAWLSGYACRMPITIDNTGSSSLSYQPYNFTVDTATLVSAGKMFANGSDVEIATRTDIVLDWWNETDFNDASTKIWVNGTFLSNTVDTAHYMYYNKSSDVTFDGDISATFDYGEDFEYGSVEYDLIANTDWVNTLTPNTFETAAISKGGKYSGNQSSTIGDGRMQLGILKYTLASEKFCYEYNWYVSGTSSYHLISMMESGFGGVSLGMGLISPGVLSHAVSFSWFDVTTCSATAWHKMKVVIDPTTNTYDLFMNGTQVLSASHFRQHSPCGTVELSVGAVSGYIDNIFVREYHDNDLTISLGSEETGFAGTGVHGQVYEGTTQTNTPIPSVAVSIYNSTWSDLTGTDASGYYAFTNLSNSTYSISFKKDRYATIEYQYTTPTENEMYRKDIWLQKETPPFYIRHFVTFCVCDLWGNRYADVDVICYLDGTVDKSGTTGTDGTKTFDLYEDSEYRITFINATRGINYEITQTPRDEYYWIYIDSFDWTPPENQTIRDTIDWYWTSERINVTHGWINFSYTDSASETTQIDYWINSSNNTNLYHFGTASPTAWTVNQIVGSVNQTYIVHFSAAHPRFDSLVGSVKHTVSFRGLRVDFKWDEQWMYDTVAVCAIIFIGLLFSSTSVNVGAVVCALSGWMFMWMGWLSGTTINYGMMVLATIVAIGVSMRKGETIHT